MSKIERNFYSALDREILTFQLLDIAITLVKRIRRYAEENGILLGESHALNRLLKEAQNILDETNYLEDKSKSLIEHIRRKETHWESDAEEPEPVCGYCQVDVGLEPCKESSDSISFVF